MEHNDQVQLELQQQYDSMTSRIAALDVDLGRELDAERRQVLQGRRDEAAHERRRIVAHQTALEAGMDVEDSRPANSRRKPERKQAMEYDELIKLVYEIRSDVAVLKEQMVQLKNYRIGDVATFPPQYLMLLVIGGVVTLLLLLYIVMRIGAL